MRISVLALASAIVFGSGSIAASADALPGYPGATKQPVSSHMKVVAMCGRRVSVDASYDSNDSPEKVAAWYKSRIPGALVFRRNDDPDQTNVDVYDSGGARAAIISKMHFSSALAASAATLGMDKTTIGIESFDPPLGRALLDLMQQGYSGQAKAARAKIAATCPNG